MADKSYKLVRIALEVLQLGFTETVATQVPEEYSVMVLAALDPFIFQQAPLLAEEVQLLADCFAPVFAMKIPIAAEALILRGLLRAFAVQRSRTCFLLAVTEDGRSQVEAWIEQHGQAA